MTVFAYVMLIGTPAAFAVGWFGAAFFCGRSLRKIDQEIARSGGDD